MFPSHFKRIIENYLDAYNQMDVHRMMENFDQTIEFEHQVDGRIVLKLTGFREFKEQAELAKSIFIKRRQTPSNWQFEGTKVIVKIDFEGILAQDIQDNLKAGDTLKMQGESEFVFFQNKIIQITDRTNS